MTDVAALVQKLIEAGTPPELAASVVAQAFVAGASAAVFRGNSADEAAERRRAKDRERKRLARTSAENPQTSAESADAQLSLSSSETKKERNEIARGRTLPPDWQPSPAHLALGRKLGHSTDRVYEIADEMRDWAAANSNRAIGRKADWDRTFNGFLRRAKVVKPVNGQPVELPPKNGEVRGSQIWFHAETEEYRRRGGKMRERYGGWWFPREAA